MQQHRIDISNTARESRAAVSQCVNELPFTTACTRKLDPTAELMWIDRALPVRSFYLQRLGANRRTYQRANRFFGMDSVLTKCALAHAMESLESLRQPRQHHPPAVHTTDIHPPTATSPLPSDSNHCMPQSWCLPRDYHSFHTDNKGPTQPCWYIAKPDRGRCGRGIALFSSRTDLLTAFCAGELSGEDNTPPTPTAPTAPTAPAPSTSETPVCTATNLPSVQSKPSIPLEKRDPVIVQEYIPDPLLFRDTGCKFDLRIYVLITSLTPLTVAILDEGLVRVASTAYAAPSASNCMTATMHLTNSHINSKVQGSATQSTPEDKHEGDDTEQPEEALLKHCLTTTLLEISTHHTISTQELWDRVCQSVATAVLAVYPSAALAHSQCFAPNREEHFDRCFQLLGVDVLLDSKLKPWILEINNSPSLNLSTETDAAIKIPLIKSLLTKVFDYADPEIKQDSTKGTATTTTVGTTLGPTTPTDLWGGVNFVPTFQPLDLTTVVCHRFNDSASSVAVVTIQTAILNMYRKICGWKCASLRPVKSTIPAKEIWKKLIDKGIALPNVQRLKDVSLDIFSQWVSNQQSASLSILQVLEKIEDALV